MNLGVEVNLSTENTLETGDYFDGVTIKQAGN